LNLTLTDLSIAESAGKAEKTRDSDVKQKSLRLTSRGFLFASSIPQLLPCPLLRHPPEKEN